MDWIILAASIFNLFLALFVWMRNPKNSLNVWFGIFGMVTAIYILFDFLFRLYPTLWILRTTYGLAALVPATATIWVLKIAKIKLQHPRLTGFLLLTPGIVFLALAHIDGLLVERIHTLTILGFKGELGPLFGIYSVYFLIYITLLVGVLYWGQRKAFNVKKLQLRLILFGIFSYSALAVSLSLVLPTFFGIYDFTMLDAPSSIFFVGFAAYAITRYRFMDVRLVLVRSIAFSLIILIASGVLAFATAILSQLAGINSIMFSSALVALLVALGYPPLQKATEQITNKFLYKKSYNPDELLANITSVTSSTLNLEQLVKSISERLTTSFNADKIGFALIGEDKKVSIIYKEGFTDDEAQQLTRYKSLGLAIKTQFVGSSGIAVIDELKMRFENGDYDPFDEKLLYFLSEHDVALVIPLQEKGELIGVLALGTKKSGDPYTSRDLGVLNILAGHVTIAIKNALLYEEQRQFAATLKSEVEKATADLQVANVHLKQLDQSKSEFLSIAAHQLRTPLTGIKGYISMFLEGDYGKLTPEQYSQLEQVFRSSDRLTRLIDVFLNVSRIETGRLELTKSRVQLEEVLGEVVRDLEEQAKKKNLKVTIQKPDELLPPMLADRDKIHDVMMNLVDNSIKYTEKGWVNIRLARSKSLVTFEVRDSGIGIAPDEIDRLFQKFTRAEAVTRIHTGGSGLGLFIAKKIIEAHGGRIWSESEGEGKGSMFTFTLPIDTTEKA